MLKVREKYFNIDIMEVITNIRTQVKLKQDRDILYSIKESNEDIMVCCPVHKKGNEKKPSCGVNKNTGLFHCFTCGVAGSFDVFISYCLGYNDNGDKGYEWLENMYSDSTYQTRKALPLEKRQSITQPNYISEQELDTYRYYHEYMWKRKLTEEVVQLFDVGFDPNFELSGHKIPCITFPVRDCSGNCLFVARRAIHSKMFHYPQQAIKPLYGIDIAVKNGYKTIIICESIINALTCYVYGKPALALLGTGSKQQAQLLKQYGFRHLIFGLDGDKAGDAGTQRLINELYNTMYLSYLKIPRDGRDINDLTKEEFNNLEEVPINY